MYYVIKTVFFHRSLGATFYEWSHIICL